MKLFYNFENETILTETELKKEYFDLFETGGTEAENFNYYVKHCTDIDGALEEITLSDVREISKAVLEILNGIINKSDEDGDFETGDNAFECITKLQKLLPLAEKLTSDITKTPIGDEA